MSQHKLQKETPPANYEPDTVVIDTETLDTRDSAVVLTLSAVRFSRLEQGVGISVEGGKLNEKGPHQLHLHLNVTEQLLLGRTTSKGTIDWWADQPSEARNSILRGTSSTVKDALVVLKHFIGDCQVFCRGTDFDPPILSTLHKAVGMKAPWRYNTVRDVRTYIDAFTNGRKGYIEDFTDPEWLIPHNSLHDCIRDALQMQQARVWGRHAAKCA